MFTAQVTVLWCKECSRYLQPPKHWVAAEPESKELLTFCIKKIKGLSKVSGSPARSVFAHVLWHPSVRGHVAVCHHAAGCSSQRVECMCMLDGIAPGP